MPFYETIFETGSRAVAEYKNDKEATDAITAHHEKAVTGQPGGPTGHPAERVVKVLKYKEHPATLNENMTMSKDVLKKEVDTILKDCGEVINVLELAAKIRDIVNPHVNEMGVHESQYKMEAEKELELKL